MRTLLLLAAAILAPGAAAMADPPPGPARSTDLPRPRDGDIAITNELEAARRAGTLTAFDLFIARHPRHALAETARRERAELLRRAPKPGC